jgi:glycosyltransferase involved in cell wall biosynthesis
MNSGDVSKIKILIFTPSLQCGGSEKYISLLCNHIDPVKFQVTVVVLNNNDPFFKINNPAVKIITLKLKRIRLSLFKVLQLAKNTQPDIIFTNANHLNIYLAMFKWLFPKKIIFIAQESSIVSINIKRLKFSALYSWIVKKYYKKIDAVICQSVYMKEDLVNNYDLIPAKTFIINNPVEEFAVVTPNAPVEKHQFITVGRLSTEKGIERLIRAVSLLNEPFSYHIIGEGDQRDHLNALINSLHLQNKIFLEGEKQTPFAGLEGAGLFLMGSYFDAFPNTLLEAGALGIPVIAFDVPGGISEIIINEKTGLLVKDADEKAFALAIEKAMDMNFNRWEIKACTLERFSLPVIIKYTEELFMKVYRQHRSNNQDQNIF